MSILRARWVRGGVTVLAMSFMLGAAHAQPAAAWTLTRQIVTDSFEDATVWSGSFAAPGDARVINNFLGARTGQQYGFVMESAGAGTWASLGRTFPSPGSAWTCNASIWVMPTGHDSAGRNRFNIEVIDPATFTYVALRSVDYPAGGAIAPYLKFTVGPWRASQPTLVFRVSQLGGDRQIWSFLEDLAITCSFSF